MFNKHICTLSVHIIRRNVVFDDNDIHLFLAETLFYSEINNTISVQQTSVGAVSLNCLLNDRQPKYLTSLRSPCIHHKGDTYGNLHNISLLDSTNRQFPSCLYF